MKLSEIASVGCIMAGTWASVWIGIIYVAIKYVIPWAIVTIKAAI